MEGVWGSVRCTGRLRMSCGCVLTSSSALRLALIVQSWGSSTTLLMLSPLLRACQTAQWVVSHAHTHTFRGNTIQNGRPDTGPAIVFNTHWIVQRCNAFQGLPVSTVRFSYSNRVMGKSLWGKGGFSASLLSLAFQDPLHVCINRAGGFIMELLIWVETHKTCLLPRENMVWRLFSDWVSRKLLGSSLVALRSVHICTLYRFKNNTRYTILQ